jgi:hypothetical protein
MTDPEFDNEPVLQDDYPVYCDYFYVADGKVIRSPVEGTVHHLKRALGAFVIQRCNAVARNLL